MSAADAPARLRMHGLGNRFVILDARAQDAAPDLTAAEAEALAAPAGEAPADQVITLGPATNRDGDAEMRIWNADGGVAEACGNAARCVAWLVMEATGRDAAVIASPTGPLHATRAGPTAVTVDMGAPKLDWADIPLAERMDTRRIDLKIGPIDDPYLHGPAAVSMGNPHAVFFVDDVDAINIEAVGPLVEGHPIFPERANAGFAQVTARDAIRLRVWERGAGLTQACGTGACAAVVAGVRRGLTDRRVTVTLDGGPLQIEWRTADDHVLMTGAVAWGA